MSILDLTWYLGVFKIYIGKHEIINNQKGVRRFLQFSIKNNFLGLFAWAEIKTHFLLKIPITNL